MLKDTDEIPNVVEKRAGTLDIAWMSGPPEAA